MEQDQEFTFSPHINSFRSRSRSGSPSVCNSNSRSRSRSADRIRARSADSRQTGAPYIHTYIHTLLDVPYLHQFVSVTRPSVSVTFSI